MSDIKHNEYKKGLQEAGFDQLEVLLDNNENPAYRMRKTQITINGVKIPFKSYELNHTGQSETMELVIKINAPAFVIYNSEKDLRKVVDQYRSQVKLNENIGSISQDIIEEE